MAPIIDMGGVGGIEVVTRQREMQDGRRSRRPGAFSVPFVIDYQVTIDYPSCFRIIYLFFGNLFEAILGAKSRRGTR